LQEVERQRVDGATMSARHGLGHAHGVEDRLFGRLGRGLEQARHRVGREHPHVADLLVLADMIGGRERDEDIAASVGADAADPGEARRRPAGEPLALERDERRIGRQNDDDGTFRLRRRTCAFF
jgi:hypothetical protein